MAKVFCLTDPNGQLLDPSIQATVLAKYSRSPMSAKDILSDMTSDEANKFNDKWVVKYGHNSVAELATVPICIEGLSIVASKVIETIQRGAYSEKSTRYQRFSRESFVTPPGGPPTMKLFASKFYSAYDDLHDGVVERCAELTGQSPDSKAVTARAFDNLRYLLPAGTGTNVACVLNMRDARQLISTLTGHLNTELQEIGKKVLEAVSEVCPVLVRHAVPDLFEPRVKSLGDIPDKFDPSNPGWSVSIRHCDASPGGSSSDVENRFMKDVESMYGMDWESFNKHMFSRPEHQEVPKIFDTVKISFDIIMDYGAFRDLQRHRRCEQFVEPLSTQYGFVIPQDIAGSDLEESYVSVMESARSYIDESIQIQDFYQYMVPLGYLHRSVFQMTLRELYYIAELRTRPSGHISYRRVAYEMFALASKTYPKLMAWCKVIDPSL